MTGWKLIAEYNRDEHGEVILFQPKSGDGVVSDFFADIAADLNHIAYCRGTEADVERYNKIFEAWEMIEMMEAV